MDDSYTHLYIETNEITLHVVTAGDKNNEPIVLLHGFPEFWYGWRHQMDYLAQAGFYVIVPDQRGYNLSDKPDGVENYHIDILARDILGLIEHFGYEKVYLGAHDWGAGIAWWIATYHAQYLKKLVILNVPHPTILGRSATSNFSQLLKSWYIFFFQIPRFPEWIGSLFDFWNAGILRASSKEDTFSEEELEEYKKMWRTPGTMTGMINWYRAALPVLRNTPVPPKKSITVPTLMLWGEQDAALTRELAQQSIELCAKGELHYFPNATHWLQHDEKDSVNRYLREFFRG